jgi:hypothetical protein
MKKVILIITAVIVILSGCSVMTGTDGDAYIAYSWVSITQVYTDDPSFGEIVYNDVYEDANEGTWDYNYTSLGVYWYGYYTVTKNPGGMFYDGDDVYFTLSLYSFGPSFYEWSYPYYHSRATQDLAAPDADTAEYTETLTKGGYTVELHVCRGEKEEN